MARKTSFYYSFLVLPAEQRRAIVAVWDFCRAVDDAVDESPAAGSETPTGRDRYSVIFTSKAIFFLPATRRRWVIFARFSLASRAAGTPEGSA